MSFDKKEIEIKIRVNKSEFDRVKAQLDRVAKFITNSHQVDEYYSPKHRNFMKEKYPYEWLSIRKRDNRCILNYKHFYPEGSEKHSHCDEFETTVSDPNEMETIFKALNIEKLVRVDKKRALYEYHDDFDIALDEVKDLGYFIEIEAKRDQGGVKATRKKILELISLLGIEKPKIDYRGYPFRMMEKLEKL